jgi:hypothetical protein
MRCARVVAITSLALLAGCGSAAGSGAAPGPSPATATVIGSPAVGSLPAAPTATESASPTVSGPGHVLTAADSGAVVALRPGDKLTVELLPGPGVYAWDRPLLTGTALRLVSVAGGYPARGPMLASFVAAAPGAAGVSASSDLPCLHSRPRCLPAQREWAVRVIVGSGAR